MVRDRRDDGSNGRLRRRELLALAGAGAVTVAGCLGGGDGDDGGGSDGDGSATATPTDTPTATDTRSPTRTEGTTEGMAGETTSGGGSAACDRLTNEYTRYDEPDSPFVATFDVPGHVAATATVNNSHGLTVRVDLGDRQPFDIFPAQLLQGTDSLTPAQQGAVDGLEVVGQVSFGGEEVPLVRAAPDNADEKVQYYQEYPYYLAGLPHEGSSGKQYYRLYVQGTVVSADGLEPQVCKAAYETAAKHLMESLEPNPDTTVESEGV